MSDENTGPIVQQAYTAGWHFDGPYGIYLCTRYIRYIGYCMRLVEVNQHGTRLGVRAGQEFIVEERSFQRAFRKLGGLGYQHLHEPPCNCFVCENREEGL